jgi:hypothetical protein
VVVFICHYEDSLKNMLYSQYMYLSQILEILLDKKYVLYRFCTAGIVLDCEQIFPFEGPLSDFGEKIPLRQGGIVDSLVLFE